MRRRETVQNMAKRGKKGGDDGEGADDHVIEFTPDGSFDIRRAASNFADMMEDLNQPLIIHLPHVSVEFEPGCTPEEIVDGFNQAVNHKVVVKPSNSNIKSPKKN